MCQVNAGQRVPAVEATMPAPLGWKHETMKKIKSISDAKNLRNHFLLNMGRAASIWLLAHLIPITSFRNKMKLAFNWVWSCMTNDPTLRLIIRPQSSDEKTARELASKKSLSTANE
jgi:hypothetical protein